MKRLLILLILLFALPAYAQQCTEETPCPELAKLITPMMGSVPVVAGTSISYVQSNESAEDGADNSATITLDGVGAGHLIVIWVKWEDAGTSFTASDGTTSLTVGTITKHTVNNGWGGFCYLLVANSGNKTYTITFNSASATYKELAVFEFHYDGTCAFDAENGATAAGTSLASGVITTASSVEVVLGGYSNVAVATTASEAINGTSASANRLQISYASAWYLIFSSTFVGGQATATVTDSVSWVGRIIAFKVT